MSLTLKLSKKITHTWLAPQPGRRRWLDFGSCSWGEIHARLCHGLKIKPGPWFQVVYNLARKTGQKGANYHPTRVLEGTTCHQIAGTRELFEKVKTVLLRGETVCFVNFQLCVSPRGETKMSRVTAFNWLQNLKRWRTLKGGNNLNIVVLN